MSQKYFAVSLLALFVCLYLIPLSTRPLLEPDEPRYAEVPREMIATGDWVVPRINGLRYFEKPVMGYWLTAVSLKIFGENDFAVRFPSAMATGITALLIFLVSSACYGRKTPLPWLAVLIYLTSLGVAAIGTVAVLDPPLTLFLAAALVAFFLATEEGPHSNSERVLLFVAGIFAGCAFMTKGFLAFVIPVLVIGPFLLQQGRWRDTLRMLWLPLAGAILVSLPWALLIHQREPDFWHYFFWNEHVRRFLSHSAQHVEPFWFFVAVLPPMFFPWVLMLPASMAGLWKTKWVSGPQKRLLVFCLCWFLFPFLFFSASSGKLITYILPCFPPLAILIAMGLMNITENIKAKFVQHGIITLATLTTVVAFALTISQLVGPEKLHLYDQSWKLALIDGVLVAMSIALVYSIRYKPYKQIIIYAFSFSLLIISSHFLIPSKTLYKKAPDHVITRNRVNISNTTSVLVGEVNIRSACWYLKRDNVYIVENAGELQYGISYDDSKHRMLTPIETGEFVRNNKGNTVIIATKKEYSRWQSFLPIPIMLDSSSKEGFLVAYY